jgi:hypothetical protein
MSSGPQPIQTGWFEVSVILSAILRACGRREGGPKEVEAQS